MKQSDKRTISQGVQQAIQKPYISSCCQCATSLRHYRIYASYNVIKCERFYF